MHQGCNSCTKRNRVTSLALKNAVFLEGINTKHTKTLPPKMSPFHMLKGQDQVSKDSDISFLFLLWETGLV